MDRITNDRLENLAKMIGEELRWLNMIDEKKKLVLDHGSKHLGRAFRLYTHEDGQGYSDRPLSLGDGYLGQTKREAFLTLVGILRALEAVRRNG